MTRSRTEMLRTSAICLAISILFSIPLFASSSIYSGHDIAFHVARIEALADAFRQGDFFPRIFFYQNSSYGYGTPLFYSSFFIMIPAFLVSLGVNPVVSYKWFLFLVTLATSFSMHASSRRILGSERKALLATLLYVFGTYRLTDVYVRSAAGEYLALMIIPFILLGAWKLIHTEERVWPLLGISFAALLLAHNISFILICGAFAVYLIFHWHALFAGGRWKQLLLAVAVGMCLAAFFLLPMLEQLKNSIYIVNGYFNQTSTMEDSLLSFAQLFQIPTTYGYLFTHQSVMNMSVGIAQIILTAVGMARFRKNREYMLLSISMFFLLFMTTRYFPWQLFHFLWFIQFSCRLLVIAFPIMSMLAAEALDELFAHARPAALCASCVMAGISIYQFVPVMQNAKLNSSDPKVMDRYLLSSGFSIKNTLDALSGQEYLPAKSTFDYAEKGLIIESSSTDSIHDFAVDYSTITFTNAPTGECMFIMPRIFYEGYVVHVYQNGVHIRDVYPYYSEEGLVTFQFQGDGTSCQFELAYQGTGIQRKSLLLSGGTALLLAVFMAVRKIRGSRGGLHA